jgi:hypothetical protein
MRQHEQEREEPGLGNVGREKYKVHGIDTRTGSVQTPVTLLTLMPCQQAPIHREKRRLLFFL